MKPHTSTGVPSEQCNEDTWVCRYITVWDQTSKRHLHRTASTSHMSKGWTSTPTQGCKTEPCPLKAQVLKLFVWHAEISQAQALCSTITEASPQPAAGIRAEEVLRGERYCFPSLSDDSDISMGRKTDVTRFRTTWCMCQKAIIQLSCHPAPLRMEAWGERDKSSRSASILRRPRASARGRVPKTRKVELLERPCECRCGKMQ